MPQQFKGLPKAKLKNIQDEARDQFDFIERIPKQLNKRVYDAVEKVPIVGKAASKGLKAVETSVAKPMLDQQEEIRQRYNDAYYEEDRQNRAATKKVNDYGKTALSGSPPSYPMQSKISRLMGVKVEKFKR
jgi:hypothetical protein